MSLADRVGKILIETLVQMRFVIVQIHLRRPAALKQIDYTFSARSDARNPGTSRIAAG